MNAVTNPFKSAPAAATLVFILCFRGWNRGLRIFNFALAALLLFSAENVFAQTTNAVAAPPLLPDAGISLLRVTGSLAIVIGIFLGGVWLYKNWQRLAVQRGRAPKLNILETRPLGARQSLFVVAYEQQRFLIATSPAGVNLVSHLPDAEAAPAAAAEKTSGPMPFAQALQQVLKGK
jgi:flagellar biogenesis protein FliO